MVHRKGIIRCSFANAFYPVQAIQWDKCNLTHFSTYFRFEDFSWMLLRATYGPRSCCRTTLLYILQTLHRPPIGPLQRTVVQIWVSYKANTAHVTDRAYFTCTSCGGRFHLCTV